MSLFQLVQSLFNCIKLLHCSPPLLKSIPLQKFSCHALSCLILFFRSYQLRYILSNAVIFQIDDIACPLKR